MHYVHSVNVVSTEKIHVSTHDALMIYTNEILHKVIDSVFFQMYTYLNSDVELLHKYMYHSLPLVNTIKKKTLLRTKFGRPVLVWCGLQSKS